MKLPLLILSFFTLICVAFALSSDGLILLSLLNHWTSVPPSISSNWSSSDSTPCSWKGVKCNHDNYVVSLDLTAQKISGQLGPEIENLSHLETIKLLRNNFSGTIPPELGNCSLLESLNLSENLFTGGIPDSLRKLQNLRNLSFYSNFLSGTIPEALFQFPHLQELYLYNNSIVGSIPSNIGNMTTLLKLYLSYNRLKGAIPPSIGNCSKLEALFLGFNMLEGVLPQSINNLKNLVYLDVNSNNLNGSLLQIESNPNLRYMDISRNSISGTIPSSFGNFTNLSSLLLSSNNFAGRIPAELGNLSSLSYLDLSQNRFEGPIPPELSNCTKMGRFDVGSNLLNGSLPSSLTKWKSLSSLILGDNRFSGDFPSFLSEFDQLLELQLGGNMFEGPIPSYIGDMQNLIYGLSLSANRFTGELPSAIGRLTKLVSLDVSSNYLRGGIAVLAKLSSLIKVNISFNSFNGSIPDELMKDLKSSPSSFLGLPDLCVLRCSALYGLSSEVSYLKPCEPCNQNNEVNHKFLFASLIVFVFAMFVAMFVAFFVVKLIRMRLSDRISMEDVMPYNEEVQELWSLMGEHGSENQIIYLRYKDEVMKATENLDDRYIIDRGGHGTIYKVELDFGVLAIKKIDTARSKRKRLSMAREIKIINKIRHQNVVTFLGFWIGEEYGLYFYSYMKNGSLHDVLHVNDRPTSLDWNVRYKIAVGVAKGLAYLHHDCDPPILHRDIKPKNILLDSDMNPYITDFGIAIALNQSSTMMRMRSTYHLGTRGYIAPEIAYTVMPSSKSDIYSYGVVLLELLTRKKVLDSLFMEKETTLVGWFKSVWREAREFEDIVDSNLLRELSDLNVVVQVMKVLLMALICTQKDPGKRLEMMDVIKIYEAPTVQGIYIQNDRRSFHLGTALATAANSIFLQARTIVIKGLPNDVKQRELPNLLRWFPGYEVSRLTFVDGRPIGYALFNTAQDAVVAKDNLQVDLFDELIFDAEMNSVLSTQMADKQYFIQEVNHDNDVRSMDNDRNTEHKTDMCSTTEKDINSSGLYNPGKGLCTDGDYPHSDYASASPSSNYPLLDLQEVNRFMASPAAPRHPYASLHDVLHVQNPLPTLEWNVRHKIAIGIAHKLAYLHHDCDHPRVNHYICPKNIFLDSNMEPHISETGVSMPSNESSSLASVPSTCFSEENGYVMVEGVESDVYNFGVVLLELITGKKVLDPSFLKNITLVEWVRSVWMETRDIDKIVDSRLTREFDLSLVSQVTEVLSVALLCTENDPGKRPTMRTVIKLL